MTQTPLQITAVMRLLRDEHQLLVCCDRRASDDELREIESRTDPRTDGDAFVKAMNSGGKFFGD